MNLDTLNDMWEKDSQLDDEKLDHDSLEIPKLHAKYLRLYNSFNTCLLYTSDAADES